MALTPSCLAFSDSRHHLTALAQPATTAFARLCAAASHPRDPRRWDLRQSTQGTRSSRPVPSASIGWRRPRSEAALRFGDSSLDNRLGTRPRAPQPAAGMLRQPCGVPYRPHKGSERCRRRKRLRGPDVKRRHRTLWSLEPDCPPNAGTPRRCPRPRPRGRNQERPRSQFRGGFASG